MLRQKLSKSSKGVAWPIVHGLFSDSVYGGKIDTVQDLRKLQAYLNLVFAPGNFQVGGKAPVQRFQKQFGIVENNAY